VREQSGWRLDICLVQQNANMPRYGKKSVTWGGAQHQDQHGKTMHVEPLRSSTEGVASIEKDGDEVLTDGDKV
jgi:hypothetical protein